ncbi:MAG: 3-oxoacyl-ACP synthase III [Puniceicoccales bacterium]|jgi:3-oxoacyl-[acyl-carrier-protein] synthase-3|nr:3-oxoacyl-ACP synthase III [Puniceicoccales bacterium]
MQFKNVVIESIGYALPEARWTSESIEDSLAPLYTRLNLPKGRLAMMTGIQERRHWDCKLQPSEISILAGRKVLKKTGIPINRIDVLIHASVCRNRLEPPTAAYVHEGLKLTPHTQIFDLSNACLGVLNAIIVGASMIEAGTACSVLIVSGENGRSLLDWTLAQLNGDLQLTRKTIKPFFANLTIGSGAVSLLLCHQKWASAPKPILLGGIAQTHSSACQLCEGGTADVSHNLTMQTDSTTLLKEGIQLSKMAWNAFKEEMFWKDDTAQCIITHQVGRQHQLQLYEALNLDPQKDFSTFPYLGNTGSVALPLTLCQADESRLLKNAMPVLLLGIGSGLSTLMLGIQWQN